MDRVFSRYGKELSPALRFGLVRLGVRSIHAIIRLPEDRYESHLIAPIKGILIETANGVITGDRQLIDDALLICSGKTHGNFILSDIDADSIRNFMKSAKEGEKQEREYKMKELAFSLEEQVEIEFPGLLNAHGAVSVVDNYGDGHAVCFYPDCDETIEIAPDFAGFDYARYLEHVGNFNYHGINYVKP